MLPHERVYTLSFVIMAAALAAAPTGSSPSLAVRGGRPEHLTAVATGTPQPSVE